MQCFSKSINTQAGINVCVHIHAYARSAPYQCHHTSTFDNGAFLCSAVKNKLRKGPKKIAPYDVIGGYYIKIQISDFQPGGH